MGKTIVLLIFICCLAGCKETDYSEQDSLQLFGISLVIGQPKFRFETPRAFNGDGYTIEVFEIKKQDRQLLSQVLAHRAGKLPNKPDHRQRWSLVHWRRTPASKLEEKFIDFAANEDDSDNEKLNVYLSQFRKALGAKSNFYSYIYFMHGSEPNTSVGDIDFFLFLPETGELFIINHNT